MKSPTLTEGDLKDLREFLKEKPRRRDSLIPILQWIQEHYGYIPPETILPVARHLALMPAEVQGVLTFYSQFSMIPRGKNLVRVCRGTACHVRGGRGIYRVVRNLLGIQEGQTTEDLKFTLETVACLGACALAPVMVVNQTYYGKMTPKRIETLLSFL
jgi:NADH-quinone oxidoreductase E subunit